MCPWREGLANTNIPNTSMPRAIGPIVYSECKKETRKRKYGKKTGSR